MEQTPRFDMKRPPVRTRWYLRPLTWVLSAPATLKRGTVLAVGSDNKMVVLGSGTGTANCVLCDDTEVGTSDVKAVAYRSGHFAIEKLTVAASYTLTAADKAALRDAGILLSNAVEM